MLSEKPVPIPVVEIIDALERESSGIGDSQWLAAQHLRRMENWNMRTLMCKTEDFRASEVVGPC